MGMRFLVVVLCLLGLSGGLLARSSMPPAAQRQIPLQATRNTRDLGGIPVAAGSVRPHRIYRSGALCFITPTDVARLERLKIRTIVDLRNDRELRREGPDRLGAARVLALPMTNSRGLGATAYRHLLRENPDDVKAFFLLLGRTESYPVLFHCSAGKDRTGILTALLLLSLGADRADVMDDYMQSIRNSRGLHVEPSWLQVVFDEVDAGGGIVPWLGKRGVTESDLQRIRAQLVVPWRYPGCPRVTRSMASNS